MTSKTWINNFQFFILARQIHFIKVLEHFSDNQFLIHDLGVVLCVVFKEKKRYNNTRTLLNIENE